MTKSRNFLTTSGRTSEFLTEIGRFSQILTKSSAHAFLPISHISHIVIPSILHRQYKILYDDRGNALSFLIWARVSGDVHVRAIQGEPWELHPSEWNEGEFLWVVDFVAPIAYARKVIGEFRRLFPNDSEIYYRRKVRNKTIVKCFHINQ